MSTLSRSRERTGVTLERAVLFALLLHAAGLFVAERWQEVLIPTVEIEQPQRPVEFRFVDTPEAAPVEPQETAPLSDLDRRAADASPRDDAIDPFSVGDTPQPVLRSPEPSSPAAESTAEATPTRPTPPTEAAAEEIVEAPANEIVESAAAGDPAAANPSSNAATPAPNLLPARPRDLRQSLTRLESFVDPQVYDNPAGGARDSGSLAEFDTRGYDLGPYLRQVLRRIETNWRSNIPPLIRTGVGGATFVNLSIRRHRNPDGTESALLVAERTWQSGQPAYDSAALFSLELSSPLPPIPDFYPHEEITGRLGFLYNLDPASVAFPEEG